MKIKKIYRFTNKRSIFRILLSDTNKLIIEERDNQKLEAFFTCLQAETGKPLWKNFQFEEKYWIGIEKIYKEIIYLHHFKKPDMPGHKSIIAFDINTQSELWRNDELVFLLIDNNKVYAFQPLFEGRKFFALDYKTGELIEDLGQNPDEINKLREKSFTPENFEDYAFPEIYNKENEEKKEVYLWRNNFFEGINLEKEIEYILKDSLILCSYYHRTENGQLDNNFIAFDIVKEKVIFKEKLNTKTNAYIPDSFFLKNDLLFLLKEKDELLVNRII